MFDCEGPCIELDDTYNYLTQLFPPSVEITGLMITIAELRRIATWRFFHLRLKWEKKINQRFDRKYGTDTAGEIALENAGVPTAETARGNGLYRPFWESNFRSILAKLPIEFSAYTFIDFGSGKGKLLLLASSFAFKRIIGIEYAPLLHEIAVRNCATYKSVEQKCIDIAPILMDALDYRIPSGPVVCFIYNAFDLPTTKVVLQHILEELARESRPAWIIYANLRTTTEIGEGLDTLKKMAGMKEVSRTRTHILFFNNAH